MKKNLLPILAVSALLLSSCSTTQLASKADGDDVYYTEAKAKAIEPVVAQAKTQKSEQTYRTDEQLYGDSYSSNRYDDDYYYSARINRFYYNSPYRPYYDYRYGYNPWYTHSYDPFFYDPWMYRPGVTVWMNRSPRYWGYDRYSYGYNRYNGYWGPYSYYNTYPGYGYGGYYNNGYYDRNNSANNPNYRPRPNRGGTDTYGNLNGTNSSGGGTVVTGGQRRGSSPRDGGRISSDNTNGNTQPANDSGSRRPRAATPDYSDRDKSQGSTSSSPRAERPAPAERYTPPPSTRDTYSPPPSNSGGSDRSSGSGSSSGGSSGGGRPSRGGN